MRVPLEGVNAAVRQAQRSFDTLEDILPLVAPSLTSIRAEAALSGPNAQLELAKVEGEERALHQGLPTQYQR